MTLSDYIDGMSSGVLKFLFTMLDRFIKTCTTIYEYGSTTLHEIIVDVLQLLNVPDFQVNIVDKILSGRWAWVYNITLIDILLGSALIAVVLFGIIKYFTDIVL